jgi:hypothetical protein
MWFSIRQASRGRRGALFVLVSPRGDVVPWYANNVRAMLPLVKAEALCSEYNRRALALPPMWAAYTGARWEWALREIYGLRLGADGLERWSALMVLQAVGVLWLGVRIKSGKPSRRSKTI